jgi:hypothetical protein
MNPIVIDTSKAATDAIDYVGTDSTGLTATSYVRCPLLTQQRRNRRIVASVATGPKGHIALTVRSEMKVRRSRRNYKSFTLSAESNESFAVEFRWQRPIPSGRAIPLRPVPNRQKSC